MKPELEAGGRRLVVRFDEPQRTLSWAVCGGGLGRASAVVWRHVQEHELEPPIDPAALLMCELGDAGLGGAVGLLTARDLSRFELETLSADGMTAHALATVGLGNALAVGDAPGPLRVGTINVLVQVSQPLGDAALAEALALASEAKTAAVLEAAVPSRRSDRLATGTGTDCLVIAAPEGGVAERWVGKHTLLGALIGGAVRKAVARGAARWLLEQPRTARARGGRR
jgi:adenosylcobinamide amidohydrolase